MIIFYYNVVSDNNEKEMKITHTLDLFFAKFDTLF